MKRLPLFLLLAEAGCQAFAADWRSMTVDCSKLETDASVANCVRKGAKAIELDEQNAAQEAQLARQAEADQPVRILVRDTASSITSFSGLGLGDKGASLSAQRDKGEDATQAKLAVFGVFKAFAEGRFQPFMGLAWQRDGAASPKKDIRQVTAGSSGPLFVTSGDPTQAFSALSTFQLSKRYDHYGSTDGTVARAHFDLAWVPLASGMALGGVSLLPHVAGLWQNRSEGDVGRGTWRSAYAGLLLVKPLELGQQHFKVSLLTRKLYDLSVPGGSTKRRERYTSISLDYNLYDTANKSAPLQPSLFLTRETGLDVLEYGKPVGKTTFGIRVKFN